MEVDIYADLPESDLGEGFCRLQHEVKQQKAHIKTLEDENDTLRNTIDKMQVTQDNLARNISELFNTARNELQRKDRTIAELRQKLDDTIFRRNNSGGKRYREQQPETDESQAKRYKFSESASEQQKIVDPTGNQPNTTRDFLIRDHRLDQEQNRSRSNSPSISRLNSLKENAAAGDHRQRNLPRNHQRNQTRPRSPERLARHNGERQQRDSSRYSRDRPNRSRSKSPSDHTRHRSKERYHSTNKDNSDGLARYEHKSRYSLDRRFTRPLYSDRTKNLYEERQRKSLGHATALEENRRKDPRPTSDMNDRSDTVRNGHVERLTAPSSEKNPVVVKDEEKFSSSSNKEESRRPASDVDKDRQESVTKVASSGSSSKTNLDKVETTETSVKPDSPRMVQRSTSLYDRRKQNSRPTSDVGDGNGAKVEVDRKNGDEKVDGTGKIAAPSDRKHSVLRKASIDVRDTKSDSQKTSFLDDIAKFNEKRREMTTERDGRELDRTASETDNDGVSEAGAPTAVNKIDESVAKLQEQPSMAFVAQLLEENPQLTAHIENVRDILLQTNKTMEDDKELPTSQPSSSSSRFIHEELQHWKLVPVDSWDDPQDNKPIKDSVNEDIVSKEDEEMILYDDLDTVDADCQEEEMEVEEDLQNESMSVFMSGFLVRKKPTEDKAREGRTGQEGPKTQEKNNGNKDKANCDTTNENAAGKKVDQTGQSSADPDAQNADFDSQESVKMKDLDSRHVETGTKTESVVTQNIERCAKSLDNNKNSQQKENVSYDTRTAKGGKVQQELSREVAARALQTEANKNPPNHKNSQQKENDSNDCDMQTVVAETTVVEETRAAKGGKVQKELPRELAARALQTEANKNPPSHVVRDSCTEELGITRNGAKKTDVMSTAKIDTDTVVAQTTVVEEKHTAKKFKVQKKLLSPELAASELQTEANKNPPRRVVKDTCVVDELDVTRDGVKKTDIVSTSKIALEDDSPQIDDENKATSHPSTNQNSTKHTAKSLEIEKKPQTSNLTTKSGPITSSSVLKPKKESTDTAQSNGNPGRTPDESETPAPDKSGSVSAQLEDKDSTKISPNTLKKKSKDKIDVIAQRLHNKIEGDRNCTGSSKEPRQTTQTETQAPRILQETASQLPKKPELPAAGKNGQMLETKGSPEKSEIALPVKDDRNRVANGQVTVDTAVDARMSSKTSSTDLLTTAQVSTGKNDENPTDQQQQPQTLLRKDENSEVKLEPHEELTLNTNNKAFNESSLSPSEITWGMEIAEAIEIYRTEGGVDEVYSPLQPNARIQNREQQAEEMLDTEGLKRLLEDSPKACRNKPGSRRVKVLLPKIAQETRHKNVLEQQPFVDLSKDVVPIEDDVKLDAKHKTKVDAGIVARSSELDGSEVANTTKQPEISVKELKKDAKRRYQTVVKKQNAIKMKELKESRTNKCNDEPPKRKLQPDLVVGTTQQQQQLEIGENVVQTNRIDENLVNNKKCIERPSKETMLKPASDGVCSPPSIEVPESAQLAKIAALNPKTHETKRQTTKSPKEKKLSVPMKRPRKQNKTPLKIKLVRKFGTPAELSQNAVTDMADLGTVHEGCKVAGQPKVERKRVTARGKTPQSGSGPRASNTPDRNESKLLAKIRGEYENSDVPDRDKPPEIDETREIVPSENDDARSGKLNDSSELRNAIQRITDLELEETSVVHEGSNVGGQPKAKRKRATSRRKTPLNDDAPKDSNAADRSTEIRKRNSDTGNSDIANHNARVPSENPEILLAETNVTCQTSSAMNPPETPSRLASAAVPATNSETKSDEKIASSTSPSGGGSANSPSDTSLNESLNTSTGSVTGSSKQKVWVWNTDRRRRRVVILM